MLIRSHAVCGLTRCDVQVEVERANGRTVLKFTRDFDDSFDGSGMINALVAHRSDPEIEYHDAREAVSFGLTAEVSGATDEDPTTTTRGGAAGAASVDAPPGGACTPSEVEGFTCSLSRLGGQVVIHYTPFAAGGTLPCSPVCIY